MKITIDFISFYSFEFSVSVVGLYEKIWKQFELYIIPPRDPFWGVLKLETWRLETVSIFKHNLHIYGKWRPEIRVACKNIFFQNFLRFLLFLVIVENGDISIYLFNIVDKLLPPG